MPTPPRTNVVAAIIEDGEGGVLLAQRPPGKRLEGMWEFPGGKIEKGETPEAAVARELEEELSLEISIDRHLGDFDYDYDWGRITLHVFVVKPLNAPRPSADVQVFKWVSLVKVSSFQLAPADLEPWSCYLASGPTTESV